MSCNFVRDVNTDFEGGTLLCYQIEDYWQQLHANNFVSSKNTAAGSAESFYCWTD